MGDFSLDASIVCGFLPPSAGHFENEIKPLSNPGGIAGSSDKRFQITCKRTAKITK